MPFFLFLNDLAGRWPLADEMMRLVAVGAVPLLAVVFLARLLLWNDAPATETGAAQEAFQNTVERAAEGPTSRIRVALGFLMALVVGCAGAWALEWLSHSLHLGMLSPRPFMTRRVNLLLAEPQDNSFPCLEVALAAMLATGLFFLHRKSGWAALGLTLLLAVARLWCGVNYFADVAWGALVGIALTICGLSLAGARLALPRFDVRLRTQFAGATATLLALIGGAYVSFANTPRFSPKLTVFWPATRAVAAPPLSNAEVGPAPTAKSPKNGVAAQAVAPKIATFSRVTSNATPTKTASPQPAKTAASTIANSAQKAVSPNAPKPNTSKPNATLRPLQTAPQIAATPAKVPTKAPTSPTIVPSPVRSTPPQSRVPVTPGGEGAEKISSEAVVRADARSHALARRASQHLPEVEKYLSGKLAPLARPFELLEVEVAPLRLSDAQNKPFSTRAAAVRFRVESGAPDARQNVAEVAARLVKAAFALDKHIQTVDVTAVVVAPSLEAAQKLDNSKIVFIGGEVPVFTASVQRKNLILKQPKWANLPTLDGGSWLRLRSRLYINNRALPPSPEAQNEPVAQPKH